jgi:hypothetical protein
MLVRRLIGKTLWPFSQGVLFSSGRHRPYLFDAVYGDARPSFIRIVAKRCASTENGTKNTVTKLLGQGPVVDEGSEVAQNEAQVGQLVNGTMSDRLRTHQFDTYRLVSALQSAGYTRPQAIALMKCLRTVLVNGTEFAKSHYLSRGDLENVGIARWNQAESFRRHTYFVLLCLNSVQRSKPCDIMK